MSRLAAPPLLAGAASLLLFACGGNSTPTATGNASAATPSSSATPSASSGAGGPSASTSATACGMVSSGSADAATKNFVGCVYWIDSSGFHTCQIPTCPFTDRLKARYTVIAGQPHGAVNVVCACGTSQINTISVDAPGASGLTLVTLSLTGGGQTKLYLSITASGGSPFVDEVRFACESGSGTRSVYDDPGTGC